MPEHPDEPHEDHKDREDRGGLSAEDLIALYRRLPRLDPDAVRAEIDEVIDPALWPSPAGTSDSGPASWPANASELECAPNDDPRASGSAQREQQPHSGPCEPGDDVVHRARLLRVDLTRFSGSADFVTRVDRHLEGGLVVGEYVRVTDDATDPVTFRVVAVSGDGRRVRLVRE